MRESAVMISSTMPSTKYSCSGSPLMFWNGSTAIDGLSGKGNAAGSVAPTLPSPAGGGGVVRGRAPSARRPPGGGGGGGGRFAPDAPPPTPDTPPPPPTFL